MGISIVTTLFSNISNPLAIFSCLMVGIVPWLGAGLLSLGGDLLKGIFSGMGKKQEDKRNWDKFMKRMKMIKPKGEYSRGKDPVTERAIQNMFASRGMTPPQYGTGEKV